MEFRAMRRIKQELDRDSASEIFKRGTSGVLAVAGDDGYPYAVPLSYAYDEGKGRLIFHSATKGHKVDALLREPKASFCVIGQDDVRPEEFTTYFRSVIAFGHVRMLEADDEKREAARLLSRRYAPDMPLEAETAEIERFWKALLMFELRIEHLTGKEAIELVHVRKNR
ncbi:5-nitroimidazole antibiotic resistance protein [Slackia equolifaciens]|uniref:5-nitroimidazole antibiotic resistance protein n=1 Tax=Slackia equolifaciens TaxID=498718 RepID=A0A3N0AY90_9ACTN|nr:pyridoxamine 5'-phosphate oxidase family protein [Slackia equolifaciens]RNL39851.1 5-nitroimidazole antibiotic resistance protein [Slackia equolifaciens]HJF66316.1 pyridoxamine 5'-phosphate oxidase family protein [Slackia equolifaciens]